ncbi:unnamed protein product [Arabidopsis halleri]
MRFRVTFSVVERDLVDFPTFNLFCFLDLEFYEISNLYIMEILVLLLYYF